MKQLERLRRASALYITCAENGLWGLQRLLRRGVNISRVVTIDSDTAVRNQVSGYVDVGPFCHKAGVPLTVLSRYAFTSLDINEESFDFVIVNGWNRLVDDSVVSAARVCAIGVHAGHPPVGLGRAPLVWNLILGKRDIEVYAFVLTPRADDGNILARQPIEITAQDDVRLLYEKVAFAGADAIYQAITAALDGSVGQSQELSFAVNYHKRSPSDGLVDFRKSETEVYNFVRAQSYPYPGAYAFLKGEKWRFNRVVPFDVFAFRHEMRVPGRIADVLPSGFVILTGGGAIWLLDADVDGCKRCPPNLNEASSYIGQCFVGAMA